MQSKPSQHGSSCMKVPVVVAGLFLPGVALLRHFSRLGIPAYGVDDDPEVIGYHSRFGGKRLCPNPEAEPEAWLAFMLDLAAELEERPVLIATADKFVLPIGDYADVLASHYRFPRPDGTLLRDLTSKRGSFRLAAEVGFPIPRTSFAEDRAMVEVFAATASYPCLIKPEISTSWRQGQLWEMFRGDKVIRVESAEKLLAAYDVVARHDSRVVVQEVVPGPDGNLIYVVCYLDATGKMLAGFAGRKTRINPIHFGSASYVELVDEPRLQETCSAFLKRIGYRGFAGVEVKRDDQDGQFKLIEINPRFGLWDELGSYVGVDVGLVAYRDLTGETVSPVQQTSTNYRWVSLHRDVRTFFEYRREGLLTFPDWLRSLRGPIVWADPRLDDWRMSVVLLGQLMRGIVRRLIHMLIGGD